MLARPVSNGLSRSTTAHRAKQRHRAFTSTRKRKTLRCATAAKPDGRCLRVLSATASRVQPRRTVPNNGTAPSRPQGREKHCAAQLPQNPTADACASCQRSPHVCRKENCPNRAQPPSRLAHAPNRPPLKTPDKTRQQAPNKPTPANASIASAENPSKPAPKESGRSLRSLF
jgi:hypothetical protein